MSMLDGLRIVSFSHFLQGPSATQLLADLGADVIKVEPPGGAFERSWSAPDAYLGGESVFFLLANRNVRSLAADLKDDRWRAVVRRLVDEADVLIENFRPGVLDRLGLGWEEVHRTNPALVYCSLTGYGGSGPYLDRPGQDVLVQSLSGLSASTGPADAAPTPTGASIVDQHGAALGALGVLAALHGRARTGAGSRVETNLLDAALDLQAEALGYALNGFSGSRSASGISSPYYKAPYGVFRTADGFLTLSLNSLDTLTAVFDDPWFSGLGEEASFARREDVNRRVGEHLARRTNEEWAGILRAAGAWFAPVQDHIDIAADPQVVHNRSIATLDHPRAGRVRVLAHPISYNGERPGVRSAPPSLGSANRSILEELGLEDGPEPRGDDRLAAVAGRESGR